jgi:F0F1-type ATP synthase delta subunit
MKIDQHVKQELHKMYKEIRERGGIVEVTAPYRLTDLEIAELKKTFPMIRGAELILHVEPTLLAGVVIKYKSKMIDLSLKSELTNLTQLLYESL